MPSDIFTRKSEYLEKTVPIVISDVGRETFQAAVLDASHERPIVVDFWAPWCAPCRALSPLLEKLAAEYAGRIDFVKVNTDENPEIATRFAVRGIPNVKAITGGKVVSEFTGVVPEPSLRRFLDKLIPSEAEKRLAHARSAIAADRLEEAERLLNEALSLDSDLHEARLDLAEVLCRRNALEDAQRVFEEIPDRHRDERADRLAIILEQWRIGRELPSISALEAACQADPDNFEFRFQLGERYAIEGRHSEALGVLIDVVRRGRGASRESARKSMLRIFALSGDADLVGRFRRELASSLH
jgi:putative thioredoxin